MKRKGENTHFFILTHLKLFYQAFLHHLNMTVVQYSQWGVRRLNVYVQSLDNDIHVCDRVYIFSAICGVKLKPVSPAKRVSAAPSSLN